MTVCLKLEFDKQTYDIWLMEILETFQQLFWFRKLRVKENGGKLNKVGRSDVNKKEIEYNGIGITSKTDLFTILLCR